MQTNKLILIVSLALAGLYNLYLGLVVLPLSEIAQYSIVATIFGILCFLGAAVLAYREIKSIDTRLPITNKVLIVPLALAGLLILYNGLQFIRLFGFAGISIVTIVAGMCICVCALVLSLREKDENIRFYRTLLTASIGGGIMCIGIEGTLTETKSTIMLFYGVVFFSIIILCIAFYLAYQQFGQYDIKLRE